MKKVTIKTEFHNLSLEDVSKIKADKGSIEVIHNFGQRALVKLAKGMTATITIET